MKSKLFLCFATWLVLSACGPNYIYNESNSFTGDTWTYEDVQRHQFEVKDLTHQYNLIIGVKHSTAYANQNLYVKIKTIFPDQSTREQVLSLDLADNGGNWYGNCSGKTCTLNIPIQQRAIFEQAGMYRFEIEQYMRQERVSALKGLSFRVEKTKNLVKK